MRSEQIGIELVELYLVVSTILHVELSATKKTHTIHIHFISYFLLPSLYVGVPIC